MQLCGRFGCSPVSTNGPHIIHKSVFRYCRKGLCCAVFPAEGDLAISALGALEGHIEGSAIRPLLSA